jgi:hypothetical protein
MRPSVADIILTHFADPDRQQRLRFLHSPFVSERDCPVYDAV